MDDLIRRSDAITAMAKAIGHIVYDAEAISCHVMDSIPVVEPKQAWISCEERLPEAEEKVWIQTERGKVCFAMYEDGTISEDDSDWHWYDLDFEKWDEENDCGIVPEGWWEWTEFHPDCEFDCPVDEKVVAWMPLPTPYTKGADDE